MQVMRNVVHDVVIDWERSVMYITRGNDVLVKDMLIRKEIRRLRGHVGLVRGLVLSHGGKLIVSEGDAKVIHPWDTESGNCIGEAVEGHKRGVNCLALSKKGKLIVSAGGCEGTILRWDAKSGECMGEALEDHEVWVN